MSRRKRLFAWIHNNSSIFQKKSFKALSFEPGTIRSQQLFAWLFSSNFELKQNRFQSFFENMCSKETFFGNLIDATWPQMTFQRFDHSRSPFEISLINSCSWSTPSGHFEDSISSPPIGRTTLSRDIYTYKNLKILSRDIFVFCVTMRSSMS